MSHIREHCATPKITRAWKALGPGATWACNCGKQFRLTNTDGYSVPLWAWREVA